MNPSTVPAQTPAQEEEGPTLQAFLAFLAKDMDEHPERLRPLDMKLFERIRELTKGIEVDLDAPLPEDDDDE